MAEKNIILNAELPMSNAMFAMLVSKYAKTLEKCCLCPHSNGECGEFAKQGKCRAMDESINEVLVFHTGSYEFATSRKAISKLLDAQHHLSDEQYIPETVDAVIEDYVNETTFGEAEVKEFLEGKGSFGQKNNFAACLLTNLDEELGDGGFIYTIEYVEE